MLHNGSGFSLPHGGPQLRNNFLRRSDGCGRLAHIKGNRSHASVPTTAVALTNLGQVHHWLLRRPGIGSHRDFHTKAALADTHAVNGFGMKIVSNELVVALEIVVGDVEENSSIRALGALLQNVD